MSYPLIIKPEAELDLEKAFHWYNKQSPGLGREFLDCVKKSLKGFARRLSFMRWYTKKHV